MRVVTFESEAKRLNITLQTAKQAFERSILLGKIQGTVDVKNNSVICYEPEELVSLIEDLNSEVVPVTTLAEDFSLDPDQVKLIISDLLRQNKVNGTLSIDGKFISDKALYQIVIKTMQDSEIIDSYGVASKLSISESDVQKVLDRIVKQTLVIITPYSQIKIDALSQELELSTKFTLALVKKMIVEGKIKGKLDMINNGLIIENTQLKTNNKSESFYTPEGQKPYRENYSVSNTSTNKPTGAWYLAPLIFGLIGGILGYVAVKNDDPDMANNLLWLGIFMTFINIIAIWALYSWWISHAFI
jgi:hypothetical protein